MRGAALSAWTLTAAALALQAGCTGILGLSAGTASDGSLGAPCDMQGGDRQTRCGTDSFGNYYACAINACRVSCKSDSDCASTPSGDGSTTEGRCVKDDGNGFLYGTGNSSGSGSGAGPTSQLYDGQLYGCVPLSEATCSATSCGPGKLCDSSGECRTSCGGGGFVGTQLGTGGCASDQACQQDPGSGSYGCYGPADPTFTGSSGGGSSGGGSSGLGSSGGTSSSGIGGSSSGFGSSSGSFDASVGSCTGTPTYASCQDCAMQGCSCPGCAPGPTTGACTGTPMIASCAQCGSTFGCSAMYCPGCVNDPVSGCSGALQACQSNPSSGTCSMEVGCTWMTSGKTCGGAITPCESLSTDTCSSQPGCSVSSGGSIDAGGCDSGAGGACNCLSLVGPVVNVTGGGTTSPSPPTGGPVTPGNYLLTNAVYYPAPAGAVITTAQATIQISASGGSFDEISDTAAMSQETLSGTWSASGSSFDVFLSCPSAGDLSWSYSSIGSTIRLDVPVTAMTGDSGAMSMGTLVETFVLK